MKSYPGISCSFVGAFISAEHQCRNLTESDAPPNGGLICHHYTEQNSKMCTLRCNPGYEVNTPEFDHEAGVLC